MATKKISELDALSEADDNDVLVIVDVSSQTTYKISKQNFLSDIKAQIEENQLKNLLLGKESGQSLTLVDCAEKTIKEIQIEGFSMRDGIPTEDNPIEIENAGDNGSITETISNEDNTETQSFTIPCQQPMRSISTVRDIFIKIDDVWYERHYIGKVVLDGTDTHWHVGSRDSNHEFSNSYIIKNVVKKPESYSVKANILSNRFETESYNSVARLEADGIAVKTNGDLYIYCNSLRYKTREQFKTWLSNNNVELIYELNEPIDLVCTQQQTTALNQLTRAETYKGTTIISSQDLVPAYIEISYIKDLQLVIDDLTS